MPARRFRSPSGLTAGPAKSCTGCDYRRALGALRCDHTGSTLLAKPCPWLVRAAAARARDEVCWSRGVVSVAIAAIVVTVSVMSAMMAAATAVVSTEKLVEETHHILLCMS
jgi:hypothetical protein